jgi:hypothetical protein
LRTSGSEVAAGGTDEKKARKQRKNSAAQEPAGRFYLGEIKDGLPVLTKEVAEEEALLQSVQTGRPFMLVQMWTTAHEMENGRLVVVKSPLATK